jgi:hypothetical protein
VPDAIHLNRIYRLQNIIMVPNAMLSAPFDATGQPVNGSA